MTAQILSPNRNLYSGYWIGFVAQIRKGIYYELRLYKVTNDYFFVTFYSARVMSSNVDVDNVEVKVLKKLIEYSKKSRTPSLKQDVICVFTETPECLFKSIIRKTFPKATLHWLENSDS